MNAIQALQVEYQKDDNMVATLRFPLTGIGGFAHGHIHL